MCGHMSMLARNDTSLYSRDSCLTHRPDGSVTDFNVGFARFRGGASPLRQSVLRASRRAPAPLTVIITTIITTSMFYDYYHYYCYYCH